MFKCRYVTPLIFNQLRDLTSVLYLAREKPSL
jgi:hypothetical protein